MRDMKKLDFLTGNLTTNCRKKLDLRKRILYGTQG